MGQLRRFQMICELSELSELITCCWRFFLFSGKNIHAGHARGEVHKVLQVHKGDFLPEEEDWRRLSIIYSNIFLFLSELLHTSVKYMATRRCISTIGCELRELAYFEVHTIPHPALPISKSKMERVIGTGGRV